MKFVQFWKLDEDAKQTYIGRVVLRAGKIEFDGFSEHWIRLLNRKIIDPEDSQEVGPENGLKYLNALPWIFSGTMLRASKVQRGLKPGVLLPNGSRSAFRNDSTAPVLGRVNTEQVKHRRKEIKAYEGEPE